MKGIILVVSIILLHGLTNAETDVICDSHNEGKFYPDYNDCTSYYVCHKSERVPGTCHEGLTFNFATQSCEVDNTTCLACSGKGISHVGHYESCSKYYFCVGDKKTLMECPSGLYFNRNTGNCDYASVVDCEEPCPKHTAEPMFIPYRGSCRKYKICFNGEEKVITCSKGLFFNPAIKNCDLEKNVECIGTEEEEKEPLKITSKLPIILSSKIPPTKNAKNVPKTPKDIKLRSGLFKI